MPYLMSPVSRFLLRISFVLFLFSTGSALVQLYAVESRSTVSMPVRVELYESQPEAARPELSPKGGEGALNDDFVSPYTTNDSVELQFSERPDRIYGAPAFGFTRLPFKYDKTGVRELRAGPILFRATMQLELEKGGYQVLIRTRNDARLFMDGKELAFVAGLQGTSDGHNAVRDAPPLMVPSIKEFAPGNAETVFTLNADGRSHDFVLETLIGASDRRPEIGDFSVAISREGETGFRLLGPGSAVSFTDEGWAEYKRSEERRYLHLDSQERTFKSYQEKKYWEDRHDYAVQWLTFQEPIDPPLVSTFMPVSNAIDRFVGRSLEEAALRNKDKKKADREAQSKGLVRYQEDIQPIFEDNCIKCHGEKEKGDLRLDSLDRALAGGESGEASVVPGHPESSLLVELINSDDDVDYMPPKGRRLTENERSLISRWIAQGASWDIREPEPIASSRFPTKAEIVDSGLEPMPLVDDLSFLRRGYLDTVGQIPTVEEIKAFERNSDRDKRSQVIEQLLEDERWADHWVPFWQDILAENPNIVKPNLNNTGAFRWWILESFLDNKPMDRFVTDLVRMRGDQYVGPAGFGMATQNDAPMAAKATILGGAFMGTEMKCARCHDAPFQSVKQEELFAMAAMLKREPIKIPATSIVPPDKMAHRNPLIKVSLSPGESVEPEWAFGDISRDALPSNFVDDWDDSREVLAAHISSPTNTRFAKSIVNWTWKRYFGQGLIEPAMDWENADVSHPQLLDYLARELVGSDYDLKHVCRLILNSHAYQRTVLKEENAEASYLFSGHTRRRMTAEQIVDSLHLATSSDIESEELNMDQDGRRLIKHFINLGSPRRAWEFTSLSNERDRPSLTLPHAQVYVDVLEIFGWNGSRQSSIAERDHETNVMQPSVLANGIMSQRLTRLTDDHALTQLAIDADDPSELVKTLFLKTLGRYPDSKEKRLFMNVLKDGFAERVIPESQRSPAPERTRYPYVSWSNHLRSKANEIKDAIARDIEQGEPPTRFLESEWRENMEDAVWALINTPEMIFVP